MPTSLRNRQYTQDIIESLQDSKVAIIDIGSNSIRLVVYDGIKRAPMPLYNEKVLCELGRELSSKGVLNPEGVKLAEECLARFLAMVKLMGVVELHVLATAAIRYARDGRAFVERLEKRHNVHILIISGEREAELAAYGVLSSIYDPQGIAADLGGGSLELVALGNSRIAHQSTFPLGILTLIDDGNGKREKTRKLIEKYLKELPWEPDENVKELYAIGGSFRAIAKLHIARSKYPLKIIHNYIVPADEIMQMAKEISAIPTEKLADLPGAGSRKAISYVPAVLVLERLIRLTKAKRVVFSTSGIREGFLFDCLSPYLRDQDVLIASCLDLAVGSGRLIGYAKDLFAWSTPLFPKESEEEKRLRLAFCLLSEIAWRIHPEARAEWGFNRIIYSMLMGINHKERVMLATALYYRYQNKMKHDLPVINMLSDAQRSWAKLMGASAHLAYYLSGSVQGNLTMTSLTFTRGRVTLHFPKDYQVLLSDAVRKRLDGLDDAFNAFSSISK